MAIKGLTVTPETRRDPTAGLPFLGTIHLGQKRTPEMIANNQPGPDLDYFRIELAARYVNLQGAVDRIYTTQPAQLDPILIFGNTPDEAFPTWMVERGMKGQRITGRCDGEQRVMWVDDKNVMHDTQRHGSTEAPLPCRAAGGNACKVCQHSGTLKVFLVELFKQTGEYGYFFLHTGSKNNIATISGALVELYPYAALNQFAFRLGRTPGKHAGWRPYQKDGVAKITESKKALLYLEPTSASAQRIAAGLMERTGLLLEGGVLALPAPAPGMAEADHLLEASAPDVIDGDFEEADEEELEGDTVQGYRANSVYVGYDKETTQYYYVIRCEGAHNFSTYDLGLFTQNGFDTQTPRWATKDKVIQFEPGKVIMLFLNEAGEPARLEVVQA